MTDKQKIFCEKYIQCWNATEAARQAGYEGSYETLRAIGSENLTKPNIKEYIDKRIEDTCMSTNEVLDRLSAWGRGTIEPFLTDDDFSEALSVNSEDAKKAIGLIKKIKQTERKLQQKDGDTILDRKFEIELHDAKDAVIQIAKLKGMYTEKVEHSGGIEVKLPPLNFTDE
jgi:phage terminase small subunit